MESIANTQRNKRYPLGPKGLGVLILRIRKEEVD